MSQSISNRPAAKAARTGVSKSFPAFSSLLSRNLFQDFIDQWADGVNGEWSQMMNVSMDVAETDNVYEVTIDLPGINPDDIEIQVDNNTLTIQGQRSSESEEENPDKHFHRVERFSGRFARSFVLPSSVNEDESAAEFKDGVLVITLPKADEEKPRRISISR